jgi:hypothetical protein
MVFAPERHGPDGTLERVVVEFDAAVIKETGEDWPARERIRNGLGEGAGRWNAASRLDELLPWNWQPITAKV